MRQLHHGRILLVSVVLIVLGLTLSNVNFSLASPGITISVNPTVSGKAPNESFSINVTVADVPKLVSWQLNLTFNPDVLQAVSVVEGPFLKSAYRTYWYFDPSQHINNVTGWVFAAANLRSYDFGRGNGTGVLATVNFKVKAEGQSPLQFNLDQAWGTMLGNWDDDAGISVWYTFDAVDGTFQYPILLVHDVAVTNVVPSPSSVAVGGTVSINVTVSNMGNASESFDVTLSHGSSVIGTQAVTNLLPGASKVLTFSWDTKDVAVGDYTLTATASTISGETKTSDNVYSNVSVKVTQASTLPLELILAAAGGAIVVVGAGTFLYMRRRPKKP